MVEAYDDDGWGDQDDDLEDGWGECEPQEVGEDETLDNIEDWGR